jgi:polysaccharide biosynthesis/export protein
VYYCGVNHTKLFGIMSKFSLSLAILAVFCGAAQADTLKSTPTPVNQAAAPDAGKSPASPPSAPARKNAGLDLPRNYVVGAGDVLEITIWKEEGFPKQTLVRPDGGITFPLVGDFQAGGLTVDQIIDGVTERLGRYFSEPAVNVAVINSNQKVYVLGKVAKPGEILAPANIDVLQALAIAGGLTPFADEDDIIIVRHEKNHTIYFPFDYTEVSNGESLQQNIVLQRGDTVVVH